MGRASARIASFFFILGLLLTLAACSGGGGGGGGGVAPPSQNNGSLVFSLDKSSVNFDVTQGVDAPPELLTATAQGTYSGNLVILVEVRGVGIDPDIAVSISGMQGTFAVHPSINLAPGTYSGTLVIHACADLACKQELGNSPLSVAFKVTIKQGLKLEPASVDESVTSGATVTHTISVQLPTGATSFSTSLISGGGWFSIANTTPNSFDVVLAPMPSGTYSGLVQVMSGTAVVMIPIHYIVAAPPGGDRFLSASPSNLTLATTEGALVSAALSATVPSWKADVTATVEYPTEPATDWLSTSAINGGFQVQASAINLHAGMYSAKVRLKGAYPSTDVIVPVSLTVGVGLVKPADVPLTLQAETDTTALSGSVMVTTVEGQAINWTAASDAAWLNLTHAAGVQGDSIAYTLDTAKVSALSNGANYVANVAITPSNAAMTPASFKVTLFKNLPQVTNVGPYVNLAGKPLRLIVRGSGFSSIANIDARFSVQGGSISSASRVTDTEVVLNVGALSAGTHELKVSNNLGMTVPSSAVTIVTEPSYTYTAMNSGGAVKALVYDPERATLYGANSGAEKVMRFRNSGASWLIDSTPVPKVYDVGLSQDGSQLIVAANPYPSNASIRLLDPITLSQLSLTPLSGGLEPTFTYLGFGIQTTNDGRSWIGVGNQWASAVYFRTDTKAVSPLDVGNIQPDFYGGPWYASSRNGERLIIVQSASISPSPPMLYMDAADSVVHQNPAGLTFSYHFAVSEDGSRVVFESSEVRDESFALVGRLSLPSNQSAYYGNAPLISPDGSRAFLLTYHKNAYSDSSLHPRVFVFDTSTVQSTQTNLPVLGYFDIPDYPACPSNPNAYNDPCSAGVISGAISLDGKTLFYVGNSNFIVAPVPDTLSQ